MSYLTIEKYNETARLNPYWVGRWPYLSEVVNIAKTLPCEKVLEIGTMDLRVVNNSDVIDIVDRGNNIVWDITKTPWPIKDKQYDLLIALQVWEHLEGKQIEAFKEAMRVSNYSILSFPYKMEIGDAMHVGIDRDQIRKWIMCTDPIKVVEVGQRIIYVFDNNQQPIVFDSTIFPHISTIHSVNHIQGESLYKLALQCKGNAIEIGSYQGRSTSIIASGLNNGHGGTLYAIDVWNWNQYCVPFEVFKHNIRLSGCTNVIPIHNYSANVYKSKKPEALFNSEIGLLFIDGAHDYESVKEDTQWVNRVKSGGYIVFHDYLSIDDVHKAVDEFVKTNSNIIRQVGLVDGMIIFEKL
jgi:predicted O-methyltransferase YrrM